MKSKETQAIDWAVDNFSHHSYTVAKESFIAGWDARDKEVDMLNSKINELQEKLDNQTSNWIGVLNSTIGAYQDK